jgi:hypothetical protein
MAEMDWTPGPHAVLSVPAIMFYEKLVEFAFLLYLPFSQGSYQLLPVVLDCPRGRCHGSFDDTVQVD